MPVKCNTLSFLPGYVAQQNFNKNSQPIFIKHMITDNNGYY